MSDPLRGQRGCWTCRIRRKKCDESRPHCSTCESLSITCHGYGPKPDFMDNGEKERAMANSIKEIVKHTWRRKATTKFPKQYGINIKLAPKTLTGSGDNSLSDPWSSRRFSGNAAVDRGATGEDAGNTLPDKVVSKSPESDIPPKIVPTVSISLDESVLVMHFLDYVFPLQYPMYKPKLSEGGRGWLLPCLIQIKPLYHAALASSTYHHRMTISSSHTYRIAALIQQEKHLEDSLTSINQFAQSSCPVNTLGIVISVIQLMFFELFTGDGAAWQAHLQAAISMYEKANEKQLSSFGLAATSRTAIFDGLPAPEYQPGVTEEVASFKFLNGMLISLDITYSITAGTAPRLLHCHSTVIASNSQTQLEEIIACKNWVMLQIGRIAALYDQKAQYLQKSLFDCTEFGRIVEDISREIHKGFTQGSIERFETSEAEYGMSPTISDTAVVTYIFTCMASIYLHLVSHGFQCLGVLDTTISEVTRMLRGEVPARLLPALICPLFIIGSVSRREDQGLFRNIFSSPPVLDPLMKHRERILPILEDIWSRGGNESSFSWESALEYTSNIILV